jgi:multidrug efflux pump subunit AcrA (membrane-fusion protein)
MNEIAQFPTIKRADPEAPAARTTEYAPPPRNRTEGRGGWPFGMAVVLLLVGGLGYGAWGDYTQRGEVAATLQQRQDTIPNVVVGQVGASGATIDVSLPGTTFAYEVANIYARANGYIEKRNVDIGDHVKTGDVLAQLTAPELDHQISQAEATLAQTEATLRQNQASMKLAEVTNSRVGTLVKQGWATVQLGDTDPT